MLPLAYLILAHQLQIYSHFLIIERGSCHRKMLSALDYCKKLLSLNSLSLHPKMQPETSMQRGSHTSLGTLSGNINPQSDKSSFELFSGKTDVGFSRPKSYWHKIPFQIWAGMEGAPEHTAGVTCTGGKLTWSLYREIISSTTTVHSTGCQCDFHGWRSSVLQMKDRTWFVPAADWATKPEAVTVTRSYRPVTKLKPRKSSGELKKWKFTIKSCFPLCLIMTHHQTGSSVVLNQYGTNY